MGLRRRDRIVVVPDSEWHDYAPGDLIEIDSTRKFPTVLRKGPGYTFLTVAPIEPGQLGLVLQRHLGHSSIYWLLLIGPDGVIGWIPETMANYVKQQYLM